VSRCMSQAIHTKRLASIERKQVSIAVHCFGLVVAGIISNPVGLQMYLRDGSSKSELLMPVLMDLFQDTPCVWGLRFHLRKRGLRSLTYKSQAGGRIRKCQHIMLAQRWQNGAQSHGIKKINRNKYRTRLELKLRTCAIAAHVRVSHI
jgi:hypothetical protein